MNKVIISTAGGGYTGRRRMEFSNSVSLLSIHLVPLAYYNVHAYIDPGAGSLVIQVLIASAIGAIFLLKTYWIKVKLFFANLFSKFRRSNE